MQRYASLPLRATAGGGFIQHGWAKISKGPVAFAAILESLHIPYPHFSAYLTISVELLGRIDIYTLQSCGLLLHWRYA